MRDITLGDTIYPRFTTRAFATGVPTTLAGTPVLSVYEENNLVQITAQVSVTPDYDSVTGLNQATIVATSGNGYESGKSYDIVITTGTVGGVSVVGEVVGSFTVQAAPVNWAKVTSPTTAVDLAGTDLQLVDIASVLTGHTVQTGDNYARLGAPAGASVSADNAAIKAQAVAIEADTTGIAGAVMRGTDGVDTATMRGTDGAYTGTPPTASAVANAVWDALRSAHLLAGSFGEGVASVQGNVVGSVASVAGAVGSVVGHTPQTGDSFARIGVAGAGLTNIDLPNQTMDIVGSITGNLSGSVGSVTGAVGSVTGAVGSVTGAVTVGTINTDAVDAVALSSTAVDEIVDQVYDELRSTHIIAGSYGESHFGFINGQAATGTLSITQMTTDLTETTDDHYKGRTIIFLGGVLDKQGTDITAYLGSTKRLTYTATTEAPLNGQRFIIV